jgi:hypothetical protein
MTSEFQQKLQRCAVWLAISAVASSLILLSLNFKAQSLLFFGLIAYQLVIANYLRQRARGEIKTIGIVGVDSGMSRSEARSQDQIALLLGLAYSIGMPALCLVVAFFSK